MNEETNQEKIYPIMDDIGNFGGINIVNHLLGKAK